MAVYHSTRISPVFGDTVIVGRIGSGFGFGSGFGPGFGFGSGFGSGFGFGFCPSTSCPLGCGLLSFTFP
ncbi:hypothetical protein CN997_28510 [Bacillus cereus]|nr:hypothetical protein CN997_28510 [Bacillus cereus]